MMLKHLPDPLLPSLGDQPEAPAVEREDRDTLRHEGLGFGRHWSSLRERTPAKLCDDVERKSTPTHPGACTALCTACCSSC